MVLSASYVEEQLILSMYFINTKILWFFGAFLTFKIKRNVGALFVTIFVEHFENTTSHNSNFAITDWTEQIGTGDSLKED